jgi:hypothetical protein
MVDTSAKAKFRGLAIKTGWSQSAIELAAAGGLQCLPDFLVVVRSCAQLRDQ